MHTQWNNKTDLKQLGNYVYGLAIPSFGSTYIVKYVGQASQSNPSRCFQHQKEAENYLKGKGASNIAKVEMINHFASSGNFEIIILAHQIPNAMLDTMENIYRRLADSGSLLFTINDERILETKNLTNIAGTHNNKQVAQNMKVEPMTVRQIDEEYANKDILRSTDISKALQTSKKILYLLNKPGIQRSGHIGWWTLDSRVLKNIEWVICVGDSEVIDYVYNVNDISFITYDTIDPNTKGTKEGRKKGFLASGLTNHLNKIWRDATKIPCFDVNGGKWPRTGKTYL